MVVDVGRRKTVASLLLLLLLGLGSAPSDAFTGPKLSPVRASSSSSATAVFASSSSSSTASETGRTLLLGPSLVQLIVAKHLKNLPDSPTPLVVCPTKNVDKFKEYISNDLDLIADAAGQDVMDASLNGLPEESDPIGTGWREGITNVVICAEDPVISKTVLNAVMSWDGYGSNRDKGVDGPDRAILCVPVTTKINQEKSMSWMPIFNNEKNEARQWQTLYDDWMSNEYVSGKRGNCVTNVIRFGSLFGGSVDGPDELKPLGLNERVYKLSLEQYRDLRERSFDRFRLGPQILTGDDVNPKPDGRTDFEKKTLKGEELEAFYCVNGYPEVDRTNRHTLAAAIVTSLGRTVKGQFALSDDDKGEEKTGVPEEFTVLSKATGELPDENGWDEAFRNLGGAEWPNPEGFVMPEMPEQKEEEKEKEEEKGGFFAMFGGGDKKD